MADTMDYSLGQCPSAYLGLVSANDFCAPYLHEELHQVIAQLSPEQPFSSFDLRLSEDEMGLLNQMHVYSKKEYSSFGGIQNLGSDLKLFIESLAPENDKISSPIVELIVRLVNEVVLGSQQGESAWVLARAAVANNRYDLPDWHTDPCIGEECKDNESVVIFTLKGPSTLFYLLPTEMREEFNFKSDTENYIGNETLAPLVPMDSTDNSEYYELRKREELAGMINISAASSVNHGQGSVFLAGSDYGAVHTVPPIHEERLFIAIFLASKDEIKELEEQIKANS